MRALALCVRLERHQRLIASPFNRVGRERPERGQQIRLAAIGLTVGFGLAVACWFAIGPNHPVLAITIQGGFLFMALLVGPALVDIGRSRHRVRAYEPRLYALLGAELVRRVLNIVGWNQVIGRMRHSESGDSMLARFLRGTEQSETAHLLGAAATVMLAVIAAATGHLQGLSRYCSSASSCTDTQ